MATPAYCPICKKRPTIEKHETLNWKTYYIAECECKHRSYRYPTYNSLVRRWNSDCKMIREEQEQIHNQAGDIKFWFLDKPVHHAKPNVPKQPLWMRFYAWLGL